MKKINLLKLTYFLQKHNVAFIIILAILSLWAVLKFQNIPQMQLIILTMLALFYLAWALAHHYLERNLTLEIIIEYILTALLALIFFYGVII